MFKKSHINYGRLIFVDLFESNILLVIDFTQFRNTHMYQIIRYLIKYHFMAQRVRIAHLVPGNHGEYVRPKIVKIKCRIISPI